MQDAGVYNIVSSPEMYAAYLNVQGNNPMYSAGNIALAMIQNPNVTQIGTVDRWKTLGRTVRDIEKNNGIQIFAKGNFGKGYSISNAYDISQTVGRDIPTIQIEETSKEMETALTTIMNYSMVPIVPDETLSVPALYNERKLELAINPQCTFAETFPVLTAEVAQSRFHNKGKNIYYSRKECELDAESVSYLLCKRFGIKCDLPDVSRVTDLYNGWTAVEIRQALSSIQDMSKSIGGSIDKNITPPNRTRGNMHRTGR